MNVFGCALRLIFNLVELGLSDFLSGRDWARLGELDEKKLNFSEVISLGCDWVRLVSSFGVLMA